MTKLMACPFCGGEASLTRGEATEAVWPHGEFSRVFCTQCQCRQLFHRTDKDAVCAWNKRQQVKEGLRPTDPTSPDASARARSPRG